MTTNFPSQDQKRISDMEDLCTLCEPIQGPALVTTYPMKAEKRKAREELDIVNVIEWHSATSSARWFLLVKRPEGGERKPFHERHVHIPVDEVILSYSIFCHFPFL